MFPEKKKKITATCILTCNLISLDNNVLTWVEGKDLDLVALVNGIGINHEHSCKATITIELVEEPCIICGKPTFGDRICQNCGKPICDECAKTEDLERYCPICQLLKQQKMQTTQ